MKLKPLIILGLSRLVVYTNTLPCNLAGLFLSIVFLPLSAISYLPFARQVLPEVMSIWSLCSLYLVASYQPVAALAPRTFWWLKQFVLDSPLGPSS
jgi:hypothetical protein